MEPTRVIRRFPKGIVSPPPSKSLLHRGVLCGALAAAQGGESIVEPYAWSRDLAATLAGVEALLPVETALTGGRLSLRPASGTRQTGVIDCGDSATTLRLLIPLAAMLREETLFTGSERLLSRPHQPYGDAGIRMERTGGGLAVRGPLSAERYQLPGNVSSQFVSGLLLALPLHPDGNDREILLTSPLESRGYAAMTAWALARFGVEVVETASGYLVPGGQRYRPAHFRVEADYSQGAYFLCAGALGREVGCRGLPRDSVQGDRAIVPILQSMGAAVSFAGDVCTARAKGLRGVRVDVSQIPDLAPALAATLCLSEGTGRLVGAGRLRLKESDRLRALCEELGGLGADIREEEDSLIIAGKPRLLGGAADCRGDHRIAMALAVAAIGCTGGVTLRGANCVDKSYPGFWEDFEKEEKR